MIGEFLLRVTSALEATGIPYMLTGSLASSMYGVPRATNDIDIVVAPTRPQLVSLLQLFQRVGLYVTPIAEAAGALKRETQFNLIDFKTGWKVDFIVRKSREFSVTEFDRRSTVEADEYHLTIATPEDVVIAKLEWAKIGESERQLRDVAGILQMQADKLDLPYIEKWIEVLDLRDQWLAAQKLAI